MPLPAWAAQAAVGALADPRVQQGIFNAGSAGIRGLGRGAAYLGEGAFNLGGNIADTLGGLGQQYLPESVNTAGGYLRQGIGGLARGVGGLANAVIGGNQPNVAQGAAMIGPQPMNPERAMQRAYMQQIQQPYQFNYANQRQQLINQFNQQQLPQLAQRFAGNNALGSSYFNKAATGALGNLNTNLGALEELGRFNEAGLNQQRLGGIANYLNGQQQLGLGARQLAQQGTIAQRQDALRQLGLMGGFAQEQQQNYIGQLLNAINAQGGLGNIAMGQGYQPVQQAPNASPWNSLVQGGAQALGTAARAYMGIPG